jgi:hypothetical protein
MNLDSEAVNKFLRALRDDLLDRRLLPLVALVAAGVVAAFAFAIFGGSSTSSTPGLTAAVPVAKGGLPVSEAGAGTQKAVAETTDGEAAQQKGGSRDPFEPLAGAASAQLTSSVPAGKPASAAASSASSTPSGSSTSGSPGSPSTPSPSKTESPPAPKTSSPHKEKVYVRYAVSAEFGPLLEGGTAQLKPYPALKLNEPLPAANPQLVYLGVTLKTGKYAVFALTGEAIIHGPGKCAPEPTHCQAVELTAGQTEVLESFDASGHPVTYELKVTSIAKSVTTASGASVSGSGSELLQSNATLPIDGLYYSSQPGVLASATR